MNDEEKSKFERLNDDLYSRTRYKEPVDSRSTVKKVDNSSVEESWKSPALDDMLREERTAPEVKPFMKKFFLFAMLFFIAAVGVSGFVFFGGVNFISSKNVDIEVVGPTMVSAGELLDLSVTVSNKNNSDLEPATFSVQYPTGARDPEDSSKPLTFSKADLGTVSAGDEAVENVRLVLIGAIGEVKEFKFSVEYKVKGSNATFYKDKIYQVTIGNSPLSLTIDSPESVSSGDSFTTQITVAHNSTEVLRNVMLRSEYPYGFSVIDTTPEAISENNVWALGDLSPGSSKKIQIRGRLVGENQDERTMRFYAGVSDNGSNNPNFKTIILSSQQTIEIKRPAIAIIARFNGENSPNYIAPAGQPIGTNVRVQNNLSEKVINPRLEVRFTGSALNKQEVRVQNSGVYNSSTNRISWILINSQGLAELSPGDNVGVSFDFATLPEGALATGGREIGIQVVFTGTPVSNPRPISVSENYSIKIASQVSLFSKATYSIGAFANSGPIPPQVDKPTTYTITWSLGNTQGDLIDAKVTARLGSNVKWIAARSDQSENISYDEEKNVVMWELGTLNSGTGFSSAAREVAFQVELKPTALQLGTSPVLVSNIAFSGLDPTQEKTVALTNPALTTKLSTDPAFIQGDDIVVK